jgi:hypothetical protein
MVRMKHPEFDPYSASGALVMRQVDEMIASSQLIRGLPN